MVYVARNPKDVAVSFYHHYTHLHNYEGTKDDFINAFATDQIYGAFMNEHVIEFWKL
jgi:Sulfotransferase domain